MRITIDLPRISSQDTAGKVTEIIEYLNTLSESINFMMQGIDTDNLSPNLAKLLKHEDEGTIIYGSGGTGSDPKKLDAVGGKGFTWSLLDSGWLLYDINGNPLLLVTDYMIKVYGDANRAEELTKKGTPSAPLPLYVVYSAVANSASTASSATDAENAHYIGDSMDGCRMSTVDFALIPVDDNKFKLGKGNARWTDIYAMNSVIQTSDANMKKNIQRLDKKYLNFIMKLAPSSFQFIDGESGRTHIGFIAQEVEDAMYECGISDLDFAGFIRTPIENEDGTKTYVYGLRYSEFIALLTYAIQEHERRLDDLEAFVYSN